MIPIKKISKARTSLVLDHPFFGSLVLRFQVKEATGVSINGQVMPIDTMATDSVHLFFNPNFVEKLSLEECRGVLAHETLHCACLHHIRRQHRQPQKWNMAADYAINQMLSESGFKLPDPHLEDSKYKNMSAEKIYELIEDDKQQEECNNNTKGGCQNGKLVLDPGGCGSVLDAPGAGSGKEDKDGNQINIPASQAEMNQIESEWKVATAQAAQQAKSMGNLPGGLKRLVESILTPKINWKDVLRHFVDQVIKSNYSWMPPNRRYMYTGFCLPSLYAQEIGRIVACIDVSGSISQHELEIFASELTEILETFQGLELDVHYVDTKWQGKQEFSFDNLPIHLEMRGGGGTSFRPVFRKIQKEAIDPLCLIYFTDLCCSDYPKHLPAYPVLWINTYENYNGYGEPPFGDVIGIDTSESRDY